MTAALAAIRSFVARRQRVATSAQRVLERFPRLQDAVFALAVGDPQARYERWVAAYDTLDEADLAAMREEQARWEDPPQLSVLLADESGSGLSAQVYERWQATLVRGEAADWDAALRGGASEHVVLIEPETRLRPHALFMLARTLEQHPDAALIYADDDVLDGSGRRSDHYFKPDWNEALLGSQNYLGGLVCVRRSLAIQAGGFDDDAWDLFRRLGPAAAPEAIHHVPFVLSHRRGRGRASSRAVAPRLPDERPSVTVIVPTTAKLELLRPCLTGLLDRTAYPELQVLVVVNGIGTLAPGQRRYLDEVAARPQARVVFDDDRPYNFSRTNNRAVAQAGGELLCFLNDDTQVIGSDWLAAMVARLQQDRVAAVGALLLFPNGRIQHAGIVLGVGHVAGHNYARRPKGTPGYHDRARVDQDMSAVTAACMLVRRDAFEEVGGFDEALAIAFNDIDLCLRFRKAGWRVVWTPSAQLYHRESASIVRHDATERAAEWRKEHDLVHRRWRNELAADPHYSPNLSLDALQLWEPAFPPRVRYPWRAPNAAPTIVSSHRV